MDHRLSPFIKKNIYTYIDYIFETDCLVAYHTHTHTHIITTEKNRLEMQPGYAYQTAATENPQPSAGQMHERLACHGGTPPNRYHS